MSTKKVPRTFDAITELSSHHNSVTFGELIRSLRLCDEISQIELAERLGLSKQHLSAIENGKKAVSPARAAKFAQVLGYPIDQFVLAAIEDELRSAGVELHFDLRRVAKL